MTILVQVLLEPLRWKRYFHSGHLQHDNFGPGPFGTLMLELPFSLCGGMKVSRIFALGGFWSLSLSPLSQGAPVQCWANETLVQR